MEEKNKNRIIMIDDDKFIIEQLIPMLKTFTGGEVIYEIYTEARKDEIVRNIEKFDPNIIILDYNLSAYTKGTDVIKALPQNLRSKVIGFSSLPSAKESFLKSGVLGFVEKFDENRNALLKSLIEKLIPAL